MHLDIGLWHWEWAQGHESPHYLLWGCLPLVSNWFALFVVFSALPALRSEAVVFNKCWKQNQTVSGQSKETRELAIWLWPFHYPWEEHKKLPFMLHVDSFLNCLPPGVAPEVLKVVGTNAVNHTTNLLPIFPIVCELCPAIPSSVFSATSIWNCQCGFGNPVCFEIWFWFFQIKMGLKCHHFYAFVPPTHTGNLTLWCSTSELDSQTLLKFLFWEGSC